VAEGRGNGGREVEVKVGEGRGGEGGGNEGWAERRKGQQQIWMKADVSFL